MSIKDMELFAQGSPAVIAGPCSAESENQVVSVASALSSKGVSVFRAGVWKPRTRPGCFEGVGERALAWLQRVRKEYGMRVAVEVATAEHVRLALEAGIDILWVGARTTTNPFAVQEVADALSGVDIPVLVKNPVNPDLDLWIGAFERLYNAGVKRMAAIHRGFSSYGEKLYRNAPRWQLPIELRRRIPELPILCDPSHIAGRREFIMQLSQQAIDLGFDGLMVETHCNPSCALSDSRQQVTPDELFMILSKLVHRSSGNENGFEAYRKQLDCIDDELLRLLSRRMEISREIGEVKREKGLAVFQPFRYNEIMERCVEICEDGKLDADAVRLIFETIHSESMRQQLSVMNHEGI